MLSQWDTVASFWSDDNLEEAAQHRHMKLLSSVSQNLSILVLLPQSSRPPYGHPSGHPHAPGHTIHLLS